MTDRIATVELADDHRRFEVQNVVCSGDTIAEAERAAVRAAEGYVRGEGYKEQLHLVSVSTSPL